MLRAIAVIVIGLGGWSVNALAAKAITLRFEEVVQGFHSESSVTFDLGKKEVRWVKNTNLPCEPRGDGDLGDLGAFSRRMGKVDIQTYEYFEQVRNRWTKRDSAAARLTRPVGTLDGGASRWSMDGFDFSQQKAEHQMVLAEFNRVCRVQDKANGWSPIPRSGGAPAAVRLKRKDKTITMQFLAPGGTPPQPKTFDFKTLACHPISSKGDRLECVIPEWGVVRF